MLMKKIFILLMVGSLLFSCQITDVLNQEPPHNLTPDNAITDEKSAETALTGIYGEQIGYESYMSIGNHAMTAGILQRNDNPGVVVSIYYIENRLPELNLVGAAYTPFWDAFNTIINSSVYRWTENHHDGRDPVSAGVVYVRFVEDVRGI